MIYFYHFPDKGRREVLVRVKDGKYPMSPRDKGLINRLVIKHYGLSHETYYSPYKWGKSKKGKRSFSTHPDYATVVEAIKGELSDELRARVVGGTSKPLLDEVTELSADHAGFYVARKAFKYRIDFLRGGIRGKLYSRSYLALVRRGVRQHNITLTLTF